MTAKPEAFDNSDSKSVANSPPSYDKNFTSGPVEQGQRPKPGARQTSCDDDRSMLATNIAKPGPPGLSIKSRRPSIFSFLPVGKQKRATVLSRIRDRVSAADSTPSSIDSIVNACASALTAAQLSDLLQTPNIEDHTALYWAIVNHRREVFSAFARFISNFSSECSSDLRLACMQTSNHALFSQLNLQNTDAKGESLRQFLGCPSDEIEAHEGGELDDHQFIASSRIRMFQKRLRTTQELKQEFVARGRVWWIRFYMGYQWKWRVGFGLSSPSLPACPKSLLPLETHKRQGEPDRETRPEVLVRTEFLKSLVPDGSTKYYNSDVDGEALTSSGSWLLGDWVTYDNPIYVDCDGTIHARLETRLKML